MGPNRRTDITVVEITINFSPEGEHGFPQQSADIKDLLVKAGVLAQEDKFPERYLPDDRMDWYASLVAQTALLFQQKAGHRVSQFSVLNVPDKPRRIALVEHEHPEVGASAVKLAVEIITGKRRSLAKAFGLFSAFAHDRRLPRDTEAIMKAARRRGIPCRHLERFPWKRDSTRYGCIRRNGLVLLGHGIQQHNLDGTFCIEKSSSYRGLLRNASERRLILERLELPLVHPMQARVAGIHDYYLIVVNNQLTGVKRATDNAILPVEDVHASVLDAALKINQELGLAPMVVFVRCPDISEQLVKDVSGVVDFELAPNLEPFHSKGSTLLDVTAEAILDWLFGKKPFKPRPTIAVTGTNGKTTTTRMISHILHLAGRKPGFACTDGIYINGMQVAKGDHCSITGHFEVLVNKDVDFAILETHHRGIWKRGFAFQSCDVAVCLNVTEDHLEKGNIETVEQMAEVKRALLERASDAVVLNADDSHCMKMLDFVNAKFTCLVSMQSSQSQLSTKARQPDAAFCVLQAINGEEWIVFHRDGQRLPVVACDRIPATFNGTARFNISNAMHAISACCMAGIDPGLAGKAMTSFESGYATTPGRLNIFDDLPFRVIVDFAHNPDGLANICEFVDNQSALGKKRLAFAGDVSRRDETIRAIGEAAAGHFDFYYCKEYIPVSNVEPRKVAHILKQGLLSRGIPESKIAVRGYGEQVIREILESCQPGDLLVMVAGHVEMHELPDQIRAYANVLE